MKSKATNPKDAKKAIVPNTKPSSQQTNQSKAKEDTKQKNPPVQNNQISVKPEKEIIKSKVEEQPPKISELLEKKSQEEEKLQEEKKEELATQEKEERDLEKEFIKLSIKDRSEEIKKVYFTSTEVCQIPDKLFFEDEITYVSKSDPKSKIGYAYHSDMELHACEIDHCERPNRVKCIDYWLNKTKLKEKLFHIEFNECNDAEIIKLVHSQEYYDKFYQNTDEKYTAFNTGGDIFINQHTVRATFLGLGACKKALDLILDGKISQAFCNTRPPGHHAYANVDEPTGFCFINNAAILAKYAIKTFPKVKKVLIFDWDVHHGDGTQRAMYDNKDVLFISLHKYNNGSHYPGGPGGKFTHIGEGGGAGFNINIPWNTLDLIPGDDEYIYICQKLLFPIITEFAPDLVIISAGFDSAWGDPLGVMSVHPRCYAYMVAKLKQIQPNLMLILEGGYNVQALANSSEAIIHELLNTSLPFQSIYMQEKTWKQVEDGIIPKMVLFDSFLPPLIKLLAPFWKCIQKIQPDYQEKIDQLTDKDFLDPKGCVIF